jgi:hypothetical protein
MGFFAGLGTWERGGRGGGEFLTEKETIQNAIWKKKFNPENLLGFVEYMKNFFLSLFLSM